LIEERIPASHPLAADSEGCGSASIGLIPPSCDLLSAEAGPRAAEQLLLASLLQAFTGSIGADCFGAAPYTGYSLFRWFVGLQPDDSDLAPHHVYPRTRAASQ